MAHCGVMVENATRTLQNAEMGVVSTEVGGDHYTEKTVSAEGLILFETQRHITANM